MYVYNITKHINLNFLSESTHFLFIVIRGQGPG